MAIMPEMRQEVAKVHSGGVAGRCHLFHKFGDLPNLGLSARGYRNEAEGYIQNAFGDTAPEKEIRAGTSPVEAFDYASR